MGIEAPETPTIHATVGLPYAGKTYWARNKSRPIVSPDAVRLALHGERFLPKAEEMVWSMSHYMVDSLFLAGHREVIVDATNIKPKRQREWTDRHPDCRFRWWIFPTPASVCIERAKLAGDEAIQPIIRRMAEDWDTSTIADADVILAGANEEGSP